MVDRTTELLAWIMENPIKSVTAHPWHDGMGGKSGCKVVFVTMEGTKKSIEWGSLPKRTGFGLSLTLDPRYRGLFTGFKDWEAEKLIKLRKENAALIERQAELRKELRDVEAELSDAAKGDRRG